MSSTRTSCASVLLFKLLLTLNGTKVHLLIVMLKQTIQLSRNNEVQWNHYFSDNIVLNINRKVTNSNPEVISTIH